MSEPLKASLIADNPCPGFDLELASHAASLIQNKAEEDLRKKRSKLARSIQTLRKRTYRLNSVRAQRDSEKTLVSKIKELSSLQQQVLSEANTECLDAAFSIAEKIIGDELSANKAAYQQRLQNCLDILSLDQKFKITINPQNLNETKSFIKTQELDCGIETSEGIPLGDLEFSLPAGKVRFSLQQHLDSLKSELTE